MQKHMHTLLSVACCIFVVSSQNVQEIPADENGDGEIFVDGDRGQEWIWPQTSWQNQPGREQWGGVAQNWDTQIPQESDGRSNVVEIVDSSDSWGPPSDQWNNPNSNVQPSWNRPDVQNPNFGGPWGGVQNPGWMGQWNLPLLPQGPNGNQPPPSWNRPGYGNSWNNQPEVEDPNLMQPNLNRPEVEDPNLMGPGPAWPRPEVEDPNLMVPSWNGPAVEDPNLMGPGFGSWNQPAIEDPNLMSPGWNRPAIEDPNLMGPGWNQPAVEDPNLMGPGFGIWNQPEVEDPNLMGPGWNQPAIEDPNLMGPYWNQPAVEDPNLMGPSWNNQPEQPGQPPMIPNWDGNLYYPTWNVPDQGYYNPCPGGAVGCGDFQPPGIQQPEQPFVPMCQEDVCTRKCFDYFGFNVGHCFNEECYCKEVLPEPSAPPMDWTYDNQNAWPEKYPECGNSWSQSPRNLDSSEIRDLTRKLEFENYRANISFIVENDGYGIVRLFVQEPSQLPAIQLNDPNTETPSGTYVLAMIEMHWGNSEHSIDGSRPLVEAQLYHFDLAYDTVEEALHHKGAVVAVALLFEMTPLESHLDPSLLPVLEKIIAPDDVGTIAEADLSFVPKDVGPSFAVYDGSLTHPPCTPAVQWIVSASVLNVSEDLVKAFMNIEDLSGRKVANNARKQQ